MRREGYIGHFDDLVKAVLCHVLTVQPDELSYHLNVKIQQETGTRLKGSAKGKVIAQQIRVNFLPRTNHLIEIQAEWLRGKILRSLVSAQSGNSRKHFYRVHQRSDRFIIRIASPASVM